MRTALVIVVSAAAVTGLLVFAALVAIPIAAPPPSLPTVTIPQGALRDCPNAVPGCR
jgi:hypothetical protein